ncbi:MAG: EF-hand domain-containing protein [Kiritimatiellales bacterium]
MKKLMTSYDADKDGVLSLDELTQAMGEIQMSRTQKPSQGEQSEQRSEPQEADKIAALMIEKFSSGQKGLTAGDLTRALKEIARQR